MGRGHGRHASVGQRRGGGELGGAPVPCFVCAIWMPYASEWKIGGAGGRVTTFSQLPQRTGWRNDGVKGHAGGAGWCSGQHAYNAGSLPADRRVSGAPLPPFAPAEGERWTASVTCRGEGWRRGRERGVGAASSRGRSKEKYRGWRRQRCGLRGRGGACEVRRWRGCPSHSTAEWATKKREEGRAGGVQRTPWDVGRTLPTGY